MIKLLKVALCSFCLHFSFLYMGGKKQWGDKAELLRKSESLPLILRLFFFGQTSEGAKKTEHKDVE